MATAARTVQQGIPVDLFIEVRDFNGVLIDSDVAPTIQIYSFDKDPRNAGITVADATETGAPTKLAQGIYTYEFTPAADAHVGTWFDKWGITIDGVASTAILQFSVIATPGSTDASVNEGTQVLMPNNAVIITLTDSIEATDGSVLTDGFQYYFTTTYTPMYSTVKKIRLRAGAFLNNVPDDTISLSIFEASREVDALIFGMTSPPRMSASYYIDTRTIPGTNVRVTGAWSNSGGRNGGPYLQLAMSKYASCMAIWFILSNSLGPTAKRKRLADFSVDYGEGSLAEFIKDLRKECEDWENVLQAGGFITKGGSLPPQFSQRGVDHGDHPSIGRRIDPSSNAPASNVKVQRHVDGLHYHSFRRRPW